ncbi:MAG: UDP-N-acetylglucosamine 2-epimerase (non-hydrolyzing) [Oscillospiraceae bacterium]
MKIVTIVGARPQFIKAAATSRELRKYACEVLVHTGQHYDKNMSDIFFKELSIPKPDYNLNVGSGSHARQTGEMLIKIEQVLEKEHPDCVLVYGDTNSTLAGALAASKMHIQVVHVEAGLRSYNRLMPEEQNRVLTDHISDILFTPTETAVDNLGKEGIVSNVYNVGDVMCDAVLYYKQTAEKISPNDFFKSRIKLLFETEHVMPKKWYLATIHRAENTDTIDKISEILDAFEELNFPVIFPVHPRTVSIISALLNENEYKNTIFIEPVGYIDMIFLTSNSKKVITDSGGLQKEAYIMDVPCITIRDQTEWVETLKGNLNILIKPKKYDIISAVLDTEIDYLQKENYYGEGNAAENISHILKMKFVK